MRMARADRAAGPLRGVQPMVRLRLTPGPAPLCVSRRKRGVMATALTRGSTRRVIGGCAVRRAGRRGGERMMDWALTTLHCRYAQLRVVHR